VESFIAVSLAVPAIGNAMPTTTRLKHIDRFIVFTEARKFMILKATLRSFIHSGFLCASKGFSIFSYPLAPGHCTGVLNSFLSLA
jgi:hypothetical protein